MCNASLKPKFRRSGTLLRHVKPVNGTLEPSIQNSGPNGSVLKIGGPQYRPQYTVVHIIASP